MPAFMKSCHASRAGRVTRSLTWMIGWKTPRRERRADGRSSIIKPRKHPSQPYANSGCPFNRRLTLEFDEQRRRVRFAQRHQSLTQIVQGQTRFLEPLSERVED